MHGDREDVVVGQTVADARFDRARIALVAVRRMQAEHDLLRHGICVRAPDPAVEAPVATVRVVAPIVAAQFDPPAVEREVASAYAAAVAAAGRAHVGVRHDIPVKHVEAEDDVRRVSERIGQMELDETGAEGR